MRKFHIGRVEDRERYCVDRALNSNMNEDHHTYIWDGDVEGYRWEYKNRMKGVKKTQK